MNHYIRNGLAVSAALAAMTLLGSCHSGSRAGTGSSSMDWIMVATNGNGFVEKASGRPFYPWGFNYDRDYRMRLLEDYWDLEWDALAGDFREMKALGARVVRVHLQFGKFMETPDRARESALRQLRRMLALAEKTGLYLDVTGLGCYRRKDVPSWYQAMDEAERWKAQANFWAAVACTCADSPAVFCYDLINEPVVPGEPRAKGDWLTGELEGFTYVQFITLDPKGRERPVIAREWIEQMVQAIRGQDKKHLVTLGFLPNSLEEPASLSGFPPAKVAGPLDFVCVHIYPKTASLEKDHATLRGFKTGKPLVVEEIFPLGCSSAELAQFIQQSPEVAGWISFYWGQPVAELRSQRTVANSLLADWLEKFQGLFPGFGVDNPHH